MNSQRSFHFDDLPKDETIRQFANVTFGAHCDDLGIDDAKKRLKMLSQSWFDETGQLRLTAFSDGNVQLHNSISEWI